MSETWYDGGSAALRTLVSLVAHNATTSELVQMFTVLVGEGVSERHPRTSTSRTAMRGCARASSGRCNRGTTPASSGPMDPAVPASLLLAVMDGLQIQWLLDRDREMTPVFEAFVDILLRQLAPARG